jgi:hypothetical protein
MVKNYVESVRNVISSTDRLVRECIVNILTNKGIKELELPCHDEHCYSVIAEVHPNEFRKVTHIRIDKNKRLEMLFENDCIWRRLLYVDMAYLLDEVEHAFELDETI